MTAGGEGQPELLPDLEQALPYDVYTFSRGRGEDATFHLAFGSAVDNVGAGPLLIRGHRADAATKDMTAEQRVLRADGSTRGIPGVGKLRYTISPDHAHWHLLGFDRYELRRARNHHLVRPDRKTGFCLGDRYNTDPRRRLEGEPPGAPLNGNCGQGDAGLRTVSEGISVGYGDDYRARLEGQSIAVTNLRAGRYVLVHRANGDRRLREKSYANNASSILLRLTWPSGRSRVPRVQVLERCARSERCG